MKNISKKIKKRLLTLVVMIIMTVVGCVGSPQSASQQQEIIDLDTLDMALRETSDYLNNNIPKGNIVAIINIESVSPALSNYIIQELTSNALNDKVFKVVDRQQLDLLRAELNFQLSGEVDDNAAVAIGKFLGAQTIVSGSVTSLPNRYRISIRALNVQTTEVQGQFNRNIDASQLITAFLQQTQTVGSPGVPRALPPESIPSASDITELQFGASVSGYIAAGREYWYSVRPAASGIVTVETKGNTDTYMYAYDLGYHELAASDDDGDDRNAKITLNASAGQVYYFRVRAISGTVTGSYRISASYNSSDIRSPVVPLELNPNSYKQGNIAAGGEHWYSIQPAADGIIMVETTGRTDTYMHAYNADFVELSTNDDGGYGSNAQIILNVSANKIYYFKVKGNNSNTTGFYRISASIYNIDITELQFGASAVSGNISSTGEYWYSVRSAASGIVTVETTGRTDTYMHAYNAGFMELATNDDDGDGRNAKIMLNVSANQTYYFKVRGSNSSTTGSYSISASFRR